MSTKQYIVHKINNSHRCQQGIGAIGMPPILLTVSKWTRKHNVNLQYARVNTFIPLKKDMPRLCTEDTTYHEAKNLKHALDADPLARAIDEQICALLSWS